MKICVLSDLHGVLPEIENNLDLLLICGDLSPLKIQRNLLRCQEWFNITFVDWIKYHNVKQTYFIAGNHDFFLRDCSDLLNLPENIIYLEDTLVNYKGLSIYGTPWCKEFGGWPFMLSDAILRQKYDRIPAGIDILLTHDAPFGTSDILLEKDCNWWTPEHLGNIPLRDEILKKEPKYNFHGHLHSTNHQCEMLETTKVFNTSILNEKYEERYSPKYYDI